MGTRLNFPFNGVDGTTATNSNTGSANVVAGSGNTVTLAAAAASQGTTGLQAVGSSGNALGSARFPMAASNATAACSVVYTIPASITADVTFLMAVDSTVTRQFALILSGSSGKVFFADKANTYTQILTAAQAAAGTVLRWEIVATVGTTTSNGFFTARAYNTSGTQVGSTATSSAANLTTSNIVSWTLQWPAQSITSKFDSLQIEDGRSSEIGAYTGSSTPPVANAGPDQTKNPGDTVSLAGSATASSGATITAWQWACTGYPLGASAPTITNATSQNASFTTSSTYPGRYLITLTATDDSSNVSSPDEMRVFTPALTALPIEVTGSVGGWTGGVGNANDSSDATYIESSAPTSTEATERLRLAPITTPATFSLTMRYAQSAIGGTVKTRLYEGSTMRKEWTTSISSASPTDYTLTLTSGEIATITSWNELDVESVYTT